MKRTLTISILILSLLFACNRANYVTVKHVKPVNRNGYYNPKKDKRKKRVKYVRMKILKQSKEVKPPRKKAPKKKKEENLDTIQHESDSTGLH